MDTADRTIIICFIFANPIIFFFAGYSQLLNLTAMSLNLISIRIIHRRSGCTGNRIVCLYFFLCILHSTNLHIIENWVLFCTGSSRTTDVYIQFSICNLCCKGTGYPFAIINGYICGYRFIFQLDIHGAIIPVVLKGNCNLIGIRLNSLHLFIFIKNFKIIAQCTFVFVKDCIFTHIYITVSNISGIICMFLCNRIFCIR